MINRITLATMSEMRRLDKIKIIEEIKRGKNIMKRKNWTQNMKGGKKCKKIEVSGKQNLFYSIFYKNKNCVNNFVTLISNKKFKLKHRILQNLKN